MSSRAAGRLPLPDRQAERAPSSLATRNPSPAGAASEPAVARFPWTALDRLDPGSRAAQTRQLVSRWAPLLGVEGQNFEVRWDEAARRLMRARQLRGLLESRHRILLDPEFYRPERGEGRFLLAHELSHLAQSHRGSGAYGPERLLEADADSAAAALLQSRRPARLRGRLRNGTAPRGSEEDPVCYDLGNIVAKSRERKIKAIQQALETGFWDWVVWDSEVDDVLRILQTMEFATAAAVIQKIGPSYQDKLLDNFSDSHLKKYRMQVLAAYVGVEPKLLAKYEDSLFRGMEWTALGPEEHFAVKRVILQVRDSLKRADWVPKKAEAKAIEEILAQESPYKFDDAIQTEAKDELELQKRREAAKKALKDEATGVPRIIEMARRNLSYDWNDWAVTDRETVEILDQMSEIMDDPVRMRAVAEGLEQEGLLDRFIDNIPVSALYKEIGRKTGSADTLNRRKIFLRLISYRDAYKNVKQAEELLQKGLFDWAVTDEDAFLAFQLIKVVPPRARAGFMVRKINDDETFGARLDAERSLSMKESLTANFYQGGKDGADLKSIQTQLLDDALWTREGQGRLGGLIPMAIAAGEHEWVFEQSRWRYLRQDAWRELYTDQAFSEAIIEKFRLYRPPSRRKDGTLDEGRTSFNERVAENLEGKTFGTDNFFWQYLIQGIDFLASSKDPAVFFTTSLGGEGLNLGEFQDLFGGSFVGIRFQRVDQSKFAETDYFDNKVRWDTDQGVLEMGAKLVDIGAINYLMDNFKFQSGTGNLRNMHVNMGYPKLKGQPTYLQLEVGSAVLNDVLLISTDSMVSLREVRFEGLSVELGSPRIDYENLPHPREQLDWLSVFGRAPLPGILFTGWLGKFLNLGAYGGELTGGLMTPGTRMDLTLTCQSFTVRGITTSSGQYIESLELGKIALRTSPPRDNYRQYLKDELAQLDSRIVAMTLAQGGTPNAYEKYRVGRMAAMQAKRDAIAREIAYIDEAEKEQKRLQGQQAQGPLSMHDQQKLDRLTHYLADLDKGGVNLDVGSTKITGISGKVSMGDVTLEEIHGHGRSADATIGMLGIESLNRMLRGPEYKPVLLGHDEDPAFELAIKKLELKQVDVPGAIPTEDEAAEDLGEAKARLAKAPDDYGLMARAERAGRRLEAAKVYWGVVRRIGQELSPEDREAFAKAKAYLQSEKSFHADSLSLGGVTLGVHGAGASTRLSLSAETLDAANLRAAGFSTAQISGKGVWIGADLKGGLRALADPRKNLSGGAVKADSLELTEVRHATAGKLFDKATATGLGAEMENRGRKIRLGAKSLHVEGLGITPTLGLLRKRLDYLESKESPSADELAKIKEIRAKLERLEAYFEDLRKARQDLNDARTDEARSAAEHRVVMNEELIVGGMTQFGAMGIDLRDFGVEIEGLGDILGEDFDFDAVLERGLTVRGTGPERRIWSGLDITWAHGEVSGEQSVITGSAEKIAAGEFKGEIDYSTSKIALKNVQLKSLVLDGLFFASANQTSDLQIWSDGATTLEGITIDGSFEFRDTTEKERAEDPKKKKALSRVTLDNFRIDSVSANGFGIRTSDPPMEVEVKSGTLTGLWAKGLKIGLPPDNKPITIEGEAGLEGASGLDFSAILKKALAKPDPTEKAENEGLGFEFVGDKGFTFTLGDLGVASGMFKGPDGWARFSLDKLKGSFTGKGDSMRFDQWSLGNLTVTGFHWKVGEKGFVESRGTTKILGVHLTAEVLTKLKDKEPPKGAAADPNQKAEQIRVMDKVKVTEFRIDSIISDHLVYQDDSMKVEIRPRDPATDPEEMDGYKPFFIGNLVLKDLEWTKDEKTGKGEITKGSLDLGTVEATGFFEDFKKGLKGGMALKAKGMGASFFGKDLTVLSLGEIEKTGGHFTGKGVDTRFKTGKITGGVNLGKDYAELINLTVEDVQIGVTTYGAPGMRVLLTSGTIDLVEMGKLRVEFETVSKAGKETKQVKKIVVEELAFKNIEAGLFTYDGEATTENEKKEKVVKKQHIEGRNAWIQELLINKLDHDFGTQITKLNAEVNALDPAASPFGVDGLVAKLTTQVGSKGAVTDLLKGELRGGAITADLSFQQVMLAPNRPWTSMEGTFKLTEFGLLNPDFTHTDENGKETKVTAFTDKKYGQGRLNLSGLDAQFFKNGTVRAGFKSLQGFNLQVEKEGMKITVPFAELTDFAAALKGLGTAKGLELLAAKAKMLSINGLKVELFMSRRVSSSSSGTPADPAGKEKFMVEPLGGLGGALDIEYAMTGNNPEATLPIKDGVLDFNSKDMSNPYYIVPLGVDDDGMYWEPPIYVSPCPPETEGMCSEPPVSVYRDHIVPPQPGFHPGVNTGIGNRGQINLKEMVEGLINDPPKAGATPSPPADLSGLNDLDLWSEELRLGDGKIGTESNHIVLERSSAKDNTIVIPRNKVGKELELKLPALRGKEAKFKAPDLQGGELQGKTGTALFMDVNVKITGLAHLDFTITIEIDQSRIGNIEVGDVTFLDPADPKLEDLPKPKPEDVKEVKPEEAKP